MPKPLNEMKRTVEAEILARRKRTAEEILDALTASGMSRKEFALKMGRQPSEVTKWLSGKHNFTSDLLAETQPFYLVQSPELKTGCKCCLV